MNNMKYYNDSLAYDFERFMPRTQPREQDNIVKLPTKKAAASQKKATRQLSAYATVLLLAVFMLAAFCGNIALRLRINEVSTQIADAKSELTALQSEETALEVEVDRRISYCNIEQEAKKLGMVKRSKEQVHYISVNDKNAALVGDQVIVSDAD